MSETKHNNPEPGATTDWGIALNLPFVMGCLVRKIGTESQFMTNRGNLLVFENPEAAAASLDRTPKLNPDDFECLEINCRDLLRAMKKLVFVTESDSFLIKLPEQLTIH